MLQAAAAQRALDVMDAALAGPGQDFVDSSLGRAGREEVSDPMNASTAFGNIQPAYIPPMIWPDPWDDSAQGQSYGDFSRSLAESLHAGGSANNAGGQNAGQSLHVQQQQDKPRNLEIGKILLAGTAFVVFGCFAFNSGRVVIPAMIQGIGRIKR